LLAASAGFSDAVLLPLKTASDTWRSHYGEIEPAPTQDPDQVQPLLRLIMGEFVTAREQLEDVGSRLDREYEEVARELNAMAIDPSFTAKIREQLDRAKEALARAVDEPEDGEASLDSLLAALHQSGSAAFEAAKPGDRTVQGLVAKRDFRGAADQLGGAPLLGGTPFGSIAEMLGVRFASAPRASGVFIEGAGLDAADPYTTLLLESESSIRRAKLLQTIIVGGMFLVWAMTTSSATFDGTVAGLLTAFFSAFGLDVGVDALLARVKGAAFG
jgi:hypothetical protein